MGLRRELFLKGKHVHGIQYDEIMQPYPASNYCVSCGLQLPAQEARVCPQCSYDQREPVTKITTSPRELADAVVQYGSSIAMSDDFNKYLDDILKAYGEYLHQEKKSQISNVFLLSDVAIACIVCLAYYRSNPKQDELVQSLEELLDDWLVHTYGKKGYQEAKESLASMVAEYSETFKDKKWLQSASKVLQHRVESIILSIRGPKVPEMHAFMDYLIHISSVVPPLRATLNKLEIL